MIQFLPNELQIKILHNVATITKFEDFCTLRTVDKKWNSFVPLVMHEVVISRLNSGFKLELRDWINNKWQIKLQPTYDDCTNTFTFLFDNADFTSKFRHFNAYLCDFTMYMEKDKITKFGLEF
ncbi:1313_t:CDS:2, partial [Cetraspora pellucida]